MQYAIARGVFTSLKWLWLAIFAVFVVTYAANIAPLPFKQVASQFYDSTFGMLFLPGLHLTLTLLVLGTLALFTLASWLIARRAPKEQQVLAPARVQLSHHNMGDTIQAQDQGQVYHFTRNPGATFNFAIQQGELPTPSSSQAQREALLNNYLDGIISHNRLINPTGISAPASLPIFSVNVPLERVFVHLRAVSDRPRFGMALEREQLEQETRRLYERGDLSIEEREEYIQQLRAAAWRSEMVEGILASIAKAGKDLTIEDVFTDLKAGSPVAILLGGPGAGKSTTMRWLALRMARALRANAPLEQAYAPARIPLLLRISDYAAYLVDPERKIARQTGSDGRPHLFMAFVRQKLEEIDPGLPAIILEALAQGRCLVLLDGLDEVASDDLRRQVAADIFAFLNQHCLKQGRQEPFNCILITSRIVGYDPGALSQYREYTLLDLSDSQIEAFLSSWCPAVELSLVVKETRSQEENALTAQDRRRARAEGERQRNDLLRSFRDNPGIKRLAVNPLMLTILALIQRSGGRLPHRRIDLYNSVTRTLLDNWNRTRGGKRFADDEIGVAEDVLSVIAFEMHRRDLPLTHQRALELARASLAYPQSAEHVAQANVEQFLNTLSESSGLFVERGQGLYGFMHRTFQEYYAARYLLDSKSYAANAPVTVGAGDLVAFAVEHYQLPLWREPLLLAVAYKSEQEKRGTQANELIRAILNAPAACDSILQRHLLFAAACIVDCNFLYIDTPLQVKIAQCLLDLYGDHLDRGRYRALQQEIEEVALLWLRGQPKESSITTPPLLETWRSALCDDGNPQRQEGAARLLASLALDLPACQRLVLLELVPPLLQLADVLDTPGIPDELRVRLPDPAARPAHPSITDYAFVTLRLLDKDGPPGWLHTQWLTWANEQPDLPARLTQHSLELNSLLTPAAFPAERDDPNWQRQTEIGKDWQERARRDPHGLQTDLLQASSAARYPHALLYWQLLRAEMQSGEYWQTTWDRLLDAEMQRGRPATYQTCLNLRLLLAQGNENQRSAIIATLLQHLSSPARLQVQSMNTIITIFLRDLMYLRDLRNLIDLIYLRNLRNLIDLMDLRGLRSMIDLRGLRGLIGLRDLRDLGNLIDLRDLGNLIDLRDLGNLRDLRDLRNLRDLGDLRNLRNLRNLGYLGNLIDLGDLRNLGNLKYLISSLCNILRQETERPLAMLALYSVVSTGDVPELLRQHTEQSLRQIGGQASLPLEQRLLIDALRRCLGTATLPSPRSTWAAPTGTADKQAQRLNQFKERGQRNQAQQVDVEELLAACYDNRKVSEDVWKTITGEDFFRDNTVAQVAWRLLDEQWNMTREAWQDVVTRLDDEDALMCGAAALLLRKGRDIPPEGCEQAIERIQVILNDEMRSRRPLDPPYGSWRRLDDELFETLRTLAERG